MRLLVLLLQELSEQGFPDACGCEDRTDRLIRVDTSAEADQTRLNIANRCEALRCRKGGEGGRCVHFILHIRSKSFSALGSNSTPIRCYRSIAGSPYGHSARCAIQEWKRRDGIIIGIIGTTEPQTQTISRIRLAGKDGEIRKRVGLQGGETSPPG